MTCSSPTGREEANRFAVPVADLEAVQVTQAQMVELTGDGHRPPPDGHLAGAGDPWADADGE